MSPEPAPRLFDDLSEGESFETGEILLTRAMIIDFATAYDPQPMHLDEAAAQNTLFGRLVASGWQVASLSMRLMVEARPFGSTPLIGLEIDRIRFQSAVVPGTRLAATVRITALEESSNPRRGFVRLGLETRNAATGEALLSFDSKAIIPRQA